MGVISMFLFIFFILQALVFQLSYSATLVVDGVSELKNSTVLIGDTIIFQHKNQYNLYIFQNRNAFNFCNFTEATLLTKSITKSYTWNPSRTGHFYFSFNNGTNNAECLQGKKLEIEVAPASYSSFSPEQSPAAAPPLLFGGVVSSSPAYTWPSTAGETNSPANSPMATQKGSEIPFINSNPAVPLPNGEVDSATIQPLLTSGHHDNQVVGFVAIQRALCFGIFWMLM